MNKVILMGRLAREVTGRYTEGGASQESLCIARFTLAVDRRIKTDQQNADFISCIAFGKVGEFAEKYLHKGTKVILTGRIQTGSYTNKDGIKVYTTDVIAEEIEFAESKKVNEGTNGQNNNNKNSGVSEGFMSIPDGLEEELPFT